MGDMGDFFNDVKQAGQEKRANNRASSAIILKREEVEFETKNGGAHLIVKGQGCLIDFWPGTGKWISRKGPKGRGVFNLLKIVKGAA